MNVLPDDVLLVVFDFYLVKYAKRYKDTCRWQTLVHVCRRWRSIIFGSPRRLNLKIRCTPKTPARDLLDVWPALPLLIQGHIYEESDADNIIAALERSDRVYEISLYVFKSHLEKVLASMQEPFPDLTSLALYLKGEICHWLLRIDQAQNTSGPPRFERRETPTAKLFDSFLSGSAPRLRGLKLTGLSFPVLPNLPLSATHFVHLSLSNIPDFRISPETMTNYLTALTCLESLCLELPFPLPDFNQKSRLSPPLAPSVLPFLASFEFRGVAKYLEGLVTLIDAPQLDKFRINLIDVIDPETPELFQFISRTPRLTGLDEARMILRDRRDTSAQVTFSSQSSRSSAFIIQLWGGCPQWVLSSLAHFCTSSSDSSPLLSTVENFFIYEDDKWQDYGKTDGADWAEVLRPFAAVKNLYLSGESVRTITVTLGFLWAGIEAAELQVDVLPVLQRIFLDKTKASPDLMEDITRFVDARMAARTSYEAVLKSRPLGLTIAVSLWDADWDDDPFDEDEDEDGDSENDEDKDEDGDEVDAD